MKTEDTIFTDDQTMFDSEDTQFDGAANEVCEEKAADAPKPRKGVIIGGIAAGLGTGILLGGVSAYAADKLFHPAPAGGEDIIDEEELTGEESDLDSEVHVAPSMNNEMTFSEAFAQAREEVGPGGAFVWHGNVYSTYTEEEWNSMTQEEKDEYNSNFAWGGGNTASDDIEVIDVTPEDVAGQQEPGTEEVEVVTVGNDMGGEPEVEILGIVEDPESGQLIGGMSIDGHDVYLIDVDPDPYGNNEFDFAVVDANQDGMITDDEVIDITSDHLSVDEFAAAAYGADPMYAMNDGPDYINDADTDSYDIA